MNKEHRTPHTKADQHIEKFVNKHDLTVDQQFKCLVEEVGEVAEALNTNASKEEVNEELSDVMFVARTITQLVGGQGHAQEQLENTALENLEKDTTTDGNKITKEG
jgi:NTP pyrophosphatase (non-canonical NTP hydrolase)